MDTVIGEYRSPPVPKQTHPGQGDQGESGRLGDRGVHLDNHNLLDWLVGALVIEPGFLRQSERIARVLHSAPDVDLGLSV
jgi:hypothetical protein